MLQASATAVTTAATATATAMVPELPNFSRRVTTLPPLQKPKIEKTETIENNNNNNSSDNNMNNKNEEMLVTNDNSSNNSVNSSIIPTHTPENIDYSQQITNQFIPTTTVNNVTTALTVPNDSNNNNNKNCQSYFQGPILPLSHCYSNQTGHLGTQIMGVHCHCGKPNCLYNMNHRRLFSINHGGNHFCCNDNFSAHCYHPSLQSAPHNMPAPCQSFFSGNVTSQLNFNNHSNYGNNNNNYNQSFDNSHNVCNQLSMPALSNN